MNIKYSDKKLLEKFGFIDIVQEVEKEKKEPSIKIKRIKQDIKNNKQHPYNKLQNIFGKTVKYFEYLGVDDCRYRTIYANSLKMTKRPNLVLDKFIEVLELIKIGDFEAIRKDFDKYACKKEK
jgi:hypothetical protein